MNDRIQNLQSKLKDQNLDGILISNSYNIRYLTNFIGLSPAEREAWVLVTHHDIFLFTNSLYFHQTKKELTDCTVIELTPEKNLLYNLNNLIRDVKSLGFEANSLTYLEHEAFQKRLSIKLIPTVQLVEELRIYKEKTEIDKIRHACQIIDSAWQTIQPTIDIEQAEVEIAYKLEDYVRTHGAEDVAWRPIIVATGVNSANPHHHTGNTKVKKNDLVLVDLGAKVNGYISDMTRIAFPTKPTGEQKQAYAAVLEANLKAIEASKLGVKTSEIDNTARQILTIHGFAENQSQYPHNLGHGIGLEVHEKPSLGSYTIGQIENNMVFTIEPAVYLPNKFGIRIEDSVAMIGGKLKILTTSSKKLD